MRKSIRSLIGWFSEEYRFGSGFRSKVHGEATDKQLGKTPRGPEMVRLSSVRLINKQWVYKRAHDQCTDCH